jgi:hypothetical protein
MKQLTKVCLLFLLLSSSIFFLPLRFKNSAHRNADDKQARQSGYAQTGAMELHRNAGLASLQ